MFDFLLKKSDETLMKNCGLCLTVYFSLIRAVIVTVTVMCVTCYVSGLLLGLLDR